MHIISYTAAYAEKIADLLNNYLPFEPEDADTVAQAGGVQLLCLNEHDDVIGYIAGYVIEQFEDEFPYFQGQLRTLKQLTTAQTCMYTSHFVVHPDYRGRGIGTKLVDAYTQQAKTIAKTIIVVGWVQSDINKWTAEKQFTRFGYKPYQYMPRYFEPYNVYCPNCNGTCYCDAHLFIHT